MALLVGDNATHTTTVLLDPGAEMQYYQNGYTASVTGTATTGYIRVSDPYTATEVKLCVYDNGGALCSIATISISGTGWLSAAFASSFAVTSGQTYYLGIFPNNYLETFGYAGNAWAITRNTTGTYATPPSSITVPGAGDANLCYPSVYVDGTETEGAGVSKPILMNYYRNRQRS